jgi:hypothetical protein
MGNLADIDMAPLLNFEESNCYLNCYCYTNTIFFWKSIMKCNESLPFQPQYFFSLGWGSRN